MDQIELGKFINKLRIEANLTQDELAKKVDVGSGKTVSKWENGYSMPDFITLKKLSIALNVTLYELSECKRLKKKSYIEATKDYIKSSSDIFKLNIIGKVTIVIAILLGIFFGLCSIFTIDNYGTVEVYKLMSLDENYKIEGNIMITKDYNVFDLIDLGYVGNNNDFLNIDVFSINYNVYNKSNNIIINHKNNNKIEKNNQSVNLLMNMSNTSFGIIFDNDKKNESCFNDNDSFIFQIVYEDKENNINKLEFPFKLIKKYSNDF